MGEPLRIYARRVQRVGYSTFSVTLPKKWAMSRGIEKGSLVYLYEMPDGSLILRTESERGRVTRLKGLVRVVRGHEVELERSVIALYEAGYDVIRVSTVEGLSGRVRDLVRKALSRLSGVEIVEEGANYMVLEVVLDAKNLGFHRILDRMEVLVRSSLNDLLEYSLRREEAFLKSVIRRDDELDKFYFLLNRQMAVCFRNPELARELGLDEQREALPMLYYGKTLERMGDTLTQLARYLLEFRESLEEDLVKCMYRAFSCAISSFRNGDASAMRELTVMHHEYFNRNPGEILGSPILSLAGNFLSLCMDAIDARVELAAVKWPLVEVHENPALPTKRGSTS